MRQSRSDAPHTAFVSNYLRELRDQAGWLPRPKEAEDDEPKRRQRVSSAIATATATTTKSTA